MNRLHFRLWAALAAALAASAEMTCDMSGYKAHDGLAARLAAGELSVAWRGEKQDSLRAVFTIQDGIPVIRELAVRASKGAWSTLGRDLRPEFEITSGLRRLSQQQVNPLETLGIPLTPEVVGREKWNSFWDAPLMVPGRLNTNVDLPRKPEEIRVANAKYNATGCRVKTDGARLEVTFPGLEAGIFSGSLQYTVYRGANLLWQEALAKTNEPSVAYKYNGGLKGFAIADDTRIVWRDTARGWQRYSFGGGV